MADKPLVEALISTRTLLSRFLTSLSNPSLDTASVSKSQTGNGTSDQPSPSTSSSAPAPVLPLLRDSGKLLKSHTTRLSLLLLNKPFTSSAVAGVLRDLNGTCLPALMGAAELCDAERYGATMKAEVRARVRRAFREMEQLVGEVEEVMANESSQSDKSASARKTRKSSSGTEQQKDRQLTSTGVVWSACDSLVELAEMGVVGLAVLKVDKQRAMLEDALTELREWSEESTTVGDGGNNNGNEGVAEEDTYRRSASEDEDEEGDLDALFGKMPSLPAGPSVLRDTLDKALKRLQSLVILYRALAKHRIKTFPSDPSNFTTSSNPNDPNPANANHEHTLQSPPIQILTDLQTHLAAIPSTADELAAAFYALDAELAAVVLSRICASGVQAALTVRSAWPCNDGSNTEEKGGNGKEDKFTAWIDRWMDVITVDLSAGVAREKR